jgi:hypothetical protein
MHCRLTRQVMLDEVMVGIETRMRSLEVQDAAGISC